MVREGCMVDERDERRGRGASGVDVSRGPCWSDRTDWGTRRFGAPGLLSCFHLRSTKYKVLFYRGVSSYFIESTYSVPAYLEVR